MTAPLKSYVPDTDALVERFCAAGSSARADARAEQARWKLTPPAEAVARREQLRGQSDTLAREFEPEWQWLSGVYVRRHVRACFEAARARMAGNEALEHRRLAEAAEAAKLVETWKEKSEFEA